MSSPQVLRLGRLPNQRTRPRLKLTPFLASAPPPPSSVDYYSQVSGWGMYLNDQLGDCTCAEVAHQLLAASTYGGTIVRVTDNDVLKLYEIAGGYVPGDPSTDQGAEIQVVLNDWRTAGIAGHKCVAFAEIDVSNMTEVRQAVALVGSVDIGFLVPASAMAQFNAGQPWDVVSNDGGIEGGHSVQIVGYDASYIYVVTWGAVQRMTLAFWLKYVEEAWAVCLNEWLSPTGLTPAGLDTTAFGAAFAALTGSPNPFPAPPVPTPTPPPVPVPAPPADADETLWISVSNWCGQRHTGGARRTAKALETWAHEKDLG